MTLTAGPLDSRSTSVMWLRFRDIPTSALPGRRRTAPRRPLPQPQPSFAQARPLVPRRDLRRRRSLLGVGGVIVPVVVEAAGMAADVHGFLDPLCPVAVGLLVAVIVLGAATAVLKNKDSLHPRLRVLRAVQAVAVAATVAVVSLAAIAVVVPTPDAAAASGPTAPPPGRVEHRREPRR